MQGDLRNSGELKMFKLGAENGEELGLVFTEDYTSHVHMVTQELRINQVVIGNIFS